MDYWHSLAFLSACQWGVHYVHTILQGHEGSVRKLKAWMRTLGIHTQASLMKHNAICFMNPAVSSIETGIRSSPNLILVGNRAIRAPVCSSPCAERALLLEQTAIYKPGSTICHLWAAVQLAFKSVYLFTPAAAAYSVLTLDIWNNFCRQSKKCLLLYLVSVLHLWPNAIYPRSAKGYGNAHCLKKRG